MLKSYLKTTFRSFRKHRLFSLINLFGLSIGIASALFILQYAVFQLSFDKFHTKSDRIFRVMNERFEGDRMIQRGQITYSAVGPQLAEDYPEALRYTTVNTFMGNVFLYNNVPTEVPYMLLTEPSFFEMFDFEVLAGNPEEQFKNPRQVLLTESMAEKVFQTETNDWSRFVGETIQMGSARIDLAVAGVLADPPENSSLQFVAMLSRVTVFDWWGESAKFSWNSSDYFHYVELAEGVREADFEAKLDDFSDKYFRGTEVTGTFEKFHLQPLEDVYLYSDYEYENHQTSEGNMVWVLVLIALFILVMAWVNYINLTTSRSLQRAREVGVRKVVGATKQQLVFQFLTESLLMNFLALVIAITLIQALQIPFNHFIEEELSLWTFLAGQMSGLPVYVWLAVVLFVGAIISGIYPAFVLSSFQASKTLKGEFGNSSKGKLLRKGLVVFQFALSTALIAGTYLVYQQTNFMRNQNLGLNMDQVVAVQGPSITDLDTTFVTHIQAFLTSLTTNANISSAGSSTSNLGSRLPRTFNVKRLGETDGHMLNRLGMNYGFFDVYEVEMKAGRAFRPDDHKTDPRLINTTILNEKAAEILGYESPMDAVGKKLVFFGQEWNIVGVASDFHHRSLKESIEPLLILPFYNGGNDTYHVKVSGQNLSETLAFIRTTYDEFFPGDLFKYRFVDELFNEQYKSDQQFGNVFNLFSALAIGIACLGLFGLAGYTAIQKTKEIGIRKVLGASVGDILNMLSREFIGLILLANLIGLPLIYMGAQQWLDSYAYQTKIGWLFFVLPVVVVLLVSALIIVSQTLKSAKANPVNALHQE